MLTAADRARMQADLLEIRDDRAVNITIRRGNTTLAAQTVRIARLNQRAGVADSDAMQATAGSATVLGVIDLDIQPGDRFTVAGTLYEVTAIHPHRDAATMADVRLVQ